MNSNPIGKTNYLQDWTPQHTIVNKPIGYRGGNQRAGFNNPQYPSSHNLNHPPPDSLNHTQNSGSINGQNNGSDSLCTNQHKQQTKSNKQSIQDYNNGSGYNNQQYYGLQQPYQNNSMASYSSYNNDGNNPTNSFGHVNSTDYGSGNNPPMDTMGSFYKDNGSINSNMGGGWEWGTHTATLMCTNNLWATTVEIQRCMGLKPSKYIYQEAKN